MKKTILAILLLLPSQSFARVPDWWRKVGWMEADGVKADDQPDEKSGPARLAVHGPIKLRLHGISADVEVVSGTDKQVIVRLTEGDGAHVSFHEEGGDHVELLFDGVPTLRCGRLCVEIPRTSAVDVVSVSGDVVVRGVAGDVQARTISGDLEVDEASGEVRAQTVSGDVKVNAAGSAPKLQAVSTSGDVSWNGSCGSGCKLETHTLSGDVRLQVTEKSSFALHFATHDGELSDELSLAFSGARPPRESNLRARYGGGEGVVDVQTFSGDLHLARSGRIANAGR